MSNTTVNSEIRIRNNKFLYLFCFAIILYFFFLIPNAAEATLIVQAPKYVGLNSGLIGYWSFDGKDMTGFNFYRKL